MNKKIIVILFCIVIILLSGCVNPYRQSFPTETDVFCKEKGFMLGEETTKDGVFAIYCYTPSSKVSCVEDFCRERIKHEYKFYKSIDKEASND